MYENELKDDGRKWKKNLEGKVKISVSERLETYMGHARPRVTMKEKF